MSTFTNKDVISYYDKTEVHYRRAWKLKESLAMHYGYWRDDTRSFAESLLHMNDEMAKTGKITSDDYVLDAGCGVGGSSIHLAKNIGCRVTGISLFDRQIKSATANAETKGVSELVNFKTKDYTDTGFPDNHFSVVWALESVVHAPDKLAFLNEAYRVLVPGGRLIIGDYYKKEEGLTAKEEKTLNNWLHSIAASNMPTISKFQADLEKAGFSEARFTNINRNIAHSAWRQFYGSLFLRFLSWGYRIYNPNVSHFADNHYKVLHYQYIAFRKKLWDYCFVYGVKK